MLEFINDNGVLFSGLFSLLTALITMKISEGKSKRKEKEDKISTLQKELKLVKDELKVFTDVVEQEKCIDKTNGAIYVETLPNGNKRNVCGYCWENKHIKIPLIMDFYYTDYNQRIDYGRCASCKTNCYGNEE